jgi:hypothetical protein
MRNGHLLLFLLLFLISCDYIDDPNGPPPPPPGNCLDSPPIFTPRLQPLSKVLIEDFTGHRCGNCPRAGEALKALISLHGSRVVGLAIHSQLSGFFTAPLSGSKYTHDFRNSLTLAIDERFGVGPSGIPKGLISRRTFAGTRLILHTAWNQHVSTLLSESPVVDLQIKSIYKEEDSTLCVFVNVNRLQSLTGTQRLAVYLSENKFINWQKDYTFPGEDIADYEHNHVLRAAVSTPWGLPVNLGAMSVSDSTFGFTFKFDPGKWNASECTLVAFIYQSDSDEVIQVEERKMGEQ